MQQAIMLTIEEVIELENSNYEAIKKKIQRNSLKAVKVETNVKCGFEYRIELAELSEKARRKYYAAIKKEAVVTEDRQPESAPQVTMEELTEKQRAEAVQWEKVIKAWRQVADGQSKRQGELTEAFAASWNASNEKQISRRTLERKWKAYKEHGTAGLADLRGQSSRRGCSDINEVLWSAFQQWWLDEAQPAVSTVYRCVTEFCELRMPELLPIPSEQSFYRQTKKIPYPVIKYFREGDKAFQDDCLPYLRRLYDDIDSNDIWSSDYHTLDFFVKDDVTGAVFRPHAAVWIDIRSRKILSAVLVESSNSDGVILSFRKAAEQWGLPKKAYLDNGKEFLTHAFGGHAVRKTSAAADYGTNILDRCGVEMYNAAVKNAKTKIIERIFREVKNEFSKLVNTYVGGRPEERPERMKKQTKDIKNVPLLSEVRKNFDAYVEGIYNMHPSKAMGMEGKNANEVYAGNLIVRRDATQEQLNLMLLRSSRLQMVGRNGVVLKFGDAVLDYYSQELVDLCQRQKVYVRYDIEHLSTVRIYDAKERFICEAGLSLNGGYALGADANLDAIKELNHRKKQKRQAVKNYMDEQMKRITVPDMMDIVVEKALKNMEETVTEYRAKIIEPVQFAQMAKEGTYDKADEVEVDLAKMAENAIKKKQMQEL